jgi:hypothetical protein
MVLGKYTTYTPDEAATKIQSLSRNFLLRPIRMPMAQFVKAGTIYKTAKAMYEKNKKKLAGVINYAIVSHVVDLDEKLAKTLYGEAVRFDFFISNAYYPFLFLRNVPISIHLVTSCIVFYECMNSKMSY